MHTIDDSQCSIVLAALRDAGGKEVSAFDLANLAGSLAVHSRIAELRLRGHPIPPARVVAKGRDRVSFYRLETQPR